MRAHCVVGVAAVEPPWEITTGCSRVFVLSGYEVVGMTALADACGNCLADLARRKVL